MPRNPPAPSMSQKISEHLEAVLASPALAKSVRLGAFLGWVVEQELAGNRTQITERNLAVMIYERKPDFDPRLDGIVRVEAIRLRNKLREHYEGSDPAAPRITIPRGGYFPVFTGFDEFVEETPVEAASTEPVASLAARPRPFAIAAAVAAVALATLLILRPSSPPRPSAPSAADRAAAAKLLVQAHDLWRTGSNPESRDLLKKALARDPGNPQIHLIYSAVLQNLGYDQEARDEAVRAAHLAVAAGAIGDLTYEGRMRAANGDWPAAVRAYRFLVDHNPRDFDASLSLTQALASTRDLPACVDMAARARSFPEGNRNPELERLDALCRAAMSDYPGALEIVKKGEEYAESAGLRGSLSRLNLLDAGITQNMGGDSPVLLERARSLCRDLQDDICQVKAARVLGNRMIGMTRFAEAIQLYEDALPVAERLHNDQEMGNLVAGLTMALEQMGDLHAADAAYAHYAAISPGVADGYELLPLRAQFAYLRGDLGQSEVLVREAMQHGVHARTPTVESADLLLLALVQIQRGDLQKARATLQRTKQLVLQYKGPSDEAALHLENALLEAAAGNWQNSRAEMDTADGLTGQDAMSHCDVRMAALTIHRWHGDTRYILDHAAQDAAEFDQVRRRADAAAARAMLAEAQSQSGAADRARAVLAQAEAATTADSPILARLATMRAGILASSDAAEADRRAREASELASHSGFQIELYEMRLAREERRMQEDPDAARSGIAQISVELDRAGLHGIIESSRALESFTRQGAERTYRMNQ